MFSMAGEFDGFEVQQPGYYGQIGHVVMIKTLSNMFLSESSETRLEARNASPLPPDEFIRRVLVPELSLSLIADDLELPISNPKVKETLEASRVFGSVLFSDEDDLDQDNPNEGIKSTPIKSMTKSVGSPSRSCQKSALTSLHDQLVLRQLPQFVVPHVYSIFDPPAWGNCGYFAIAASVGQYGTDAFLDVRHKLLAELKSHTQDHESLVSATRTRPTVKNRRTPTFAFEVVQDLLVRLDCKEEKCTQAYWLRMPYLGYVIASAYDRPTILMDPVAANCNTFFPYRTTPNELNPIVLAFINGEHFVSLATKSVSLPYPGVYGRSNNSAFLDTTKIPTWIEKYQHQLDRWIENTRAR